MVEQESTEIQECCRLFSKIYNNGNRKQIMGLMRYSLDLSTPWISQYYGNPNDQDMTLNSEVSRYMRKLWLTESNDPMFEIFPENTDFDFLGNFG